MCLMSEARCSAAVLAHPWLSKSSCKGRTAVLTDLFSLDWLLHILKSSCSQLDFYLVMFFFRQLAPDSVCNKKINKKNTFTRESSVILIIVALNSGLANALSSHFSSIAQG